MMSLTLTHTPPQAAVFSFAVFVYITETWFADYVQYVLIKRVPG